MNSLPVPKIHLESTIHFAILLRIYLSYSRNQYEDTIVFAKSIWIHYLLLSFTMNSLTVSRIDLESTSFRQITMNSLSSSRFHFTHTIRFANCQRIHFLFRDLTLNSLSHPRNNYVNTFSLWFNYLLLDLSLNSLSVPRIQLKSTFFRNFTMNSPNISVIHFEYAIYFANFQWNHNLLWDYTMNSIFVFTKSLWLHYLDFTKNSLSVPRMHLESTIYFVISL